MSYPKLVPHATRLGLLIISLLALVAVPLAGAVSAQDNTLLEDQFNDNSNNWALATKKNTTLTVGDGVLSMELKTDNIANWATPDMTFPDDIEIAVETTTPEPSDSGDWSSALVLRADARDLSSGFYQFEVTGKGEWSFVTRTAKGDEYKAQKTGKLKSWDPTASNTLKV